MSYVKKQVFSPRFYNREFDTAINAPTLKYTPRYFSWNVYGGPDVAQIWATGDIDELVSLTNWLRCGIHIVDHDERSLWWGILYGVHLEFEKISFGVSFERLANRIQVAFTEAVPGSSVPGQRLTTTWAEDDTSIANYGTRELQRSLSASSSELAEQWRDHLLSTRSLPRGVPRPAITAYPKARLNLWGIYRTMNWLYYDQAAGLENHITSGAGTQDFGTSSQESIGQSFQRSSAETWSAANCSFRVRTEGSPSDNLNFDLRADSSGSPGTLLATGTIASSSLTDTFAWITVNFSSRYELADSTTYWVTASRSGALDGTDYYVLDVDETLGYTGGVFKYYNGSSWVARTPPADGLFKVGGEQETTRQVEDIVDDKGQFLEGADIKDHSGLYASQFRDGDQRAGDILDELLLPGKSDGSGLIWKVSRDRYLSVEEEPPDYDIQYFMKPDGNLYYYFDEDRPVLQDPTGKWGIMKDVFPPVLDTQLIGDPSLFFIEEANYDVGRELMQVTPRGIRSPYDVGEIGEG